jgi:2-keto-3-deoxy-L-fuconate dehydrogenase
MFSLSGKTAVVTGAGSGIGEAIARMFVEAGATVVVVDRDEPNGSRVAGEIGARFEAVDVGSRSACAMLAERYPVCDVLVNNAGIGLVGTVLNTEEADLDRLFAVNLKGVFFMCQAFLPGMIERGGGSVVNMASIGGEVGIRERAAYCSTKFAVVGLTKCMALDHADSGVRVNCICPGRVDTPFVTARLREEPDPEAALRAMTATQAIRRMAGTREIAAAALYLASDEAAFCTGSSLIIDGGWTAGK